MIARGCPSVESWSSGAVWLGCLHYPSPRQQDEAALGLGQLDDRQLVDLVLGQTDQLLEELVDASP